MWKAPTSHTLAFPMMLSAIYGVSMSICDVTVTQYLNIYLILGP